MIYDIQSLAYKYKEYKNINQKISLEAKKGNLIRIKKGLYSDDIEKDKVVIANLCYSPSYLSFEYVLSYYGLIPEYVSAYTSAVFNKKNNKKYSIKEAYFDYRSIPNNVFPYGITFLFNDNGIRYKIATKEKALLDLLYAKYPVRAIKDIKIMLFDDLRIDKEELKKLDFKFIFQIYALYHNNTINTFVRYIMEELKYE